MKKGVFLIVLLVLIQNVSASYISGDIYLYNDGLSKIDVKSDVPLNIKGIIFIPETQTLKGETSSLIDKNDWIWSFSLNGETYDSIFLDIHLPSSTNRIYSIEGNDHIVDFDKKTISLINEDRKLDFNIKYETERENNYFPVYLVIIFLLVLLIVIGYFLMISKNKRKLEEVFPFINDKEKEIIELLMKKSLRQKEIRKNLGIPKASFTRYILNLEKKKLIIREGEGKNKMVRLK
ncbi:hypothetical protein COU57_02015 [Candidatus Pacearchaeota archaeon CG10_big_fil_rev_8_21_14_0_10_32_14]|nr:MAG: hypothetical protein COU57_02015 [Candidatus Pacearchaeota archaeon CG10_big_fil_rev_8_21_14_0_10_32_14]